MGLRARPAIRVVEDAPQKFTVVLRPSGRDAVDGLLEMLRLLWKSQLDRHGTDDAAAPVEVSDKEAEAAVHLAATLVHWFTSGVVTRT